MHSNRSPEMLTNQLRRRHEYIACPQVCDQEKRSRNRRRDPARDLGNETMRSAREQHQESLKRLVDHVWEDYQRIKAEENEEMERFETSNKETQWASSQRSKSSPCHARSTPSPSTPRRDASLSPSRGASGYRGLSGLNDRYQEVRKKHASESRRARDSTRDEMTQRRLIDAMTNPRPDNERLNSQIRQNGRHPRIVKSNICQSDTGVSEEDDTGCEDLREFERYVKAEAARLDSALEAVENELFVLTKKKGRKKSSSSPRAMESSRSKQSTPQSRCQCSPRQHSPERTPPSRCQCSPKQQSPQPPPPSRCQCSPKQQSPERTPPSRCQCSPRQQSPQPNPPSRCQCYPKKQSPQPTPPSRCQCSPKQQSQQPTSPSRCQSSPRQQSPQPPPPSRCQCSPRQQSPRKAPAIRDVKASDSVMELHPFKSRTASGRQWTAESKSTVQFMQFEEDFTSTSCSEVSVPNTEDIEVVGKMLMELESNLKSGNCYACCHDKDSHGERGLTNNIEEIKKMISAEDRDVNLALKMARKLPPNKSTMSARCPKLRTPGDEQFPYGEVEEMTPELAAKMMEAEERGISTVSPPHKMFACLFPESAIEPLYEVGSVTTKNNLVVPLHGSQYQSPISNKDIAEMAMMSDAIRPDIAISNQNTSIDAKDTHMAERGSLTGSADITGWNDKADSPCIPGALATFEEGGDVALVYTLKPQALATNIRLRGSCKPSWFPGYYMTLPTDTEIRLATSASQVLTDVHNAVQPEIFNLPKKPVCRC